MDVLIPIETTAREALYKIYLSKLLALQGANSYLGNKSHIFFLTQLFTNYTYLDKGYHQGTSDVILFKSVMLSFIKLNWLSPHKKM